MSEDFIFFLFLFGGLPILGGLFYLIGVPFNRRQVFKKEADKIELDKRKQMAKLDLLLAERQQTWSLEDIQRHRARLEGQLDEMHKSTEA